MDFFKRNKIAAIALPVIILGAVLFYFKKGTLKHFRPVDSDTKEEVGIGEKDTKWLDVADNNNPYGAVSKDEATESKLLVTEDGKIYVAFQDGANGNRARIRMYDGQSWKDLADDNNPYGLISRQKGGDPALEIIGDEVFVAFMDRENGNRARVKKWDGKSWFDLGSEGGFISDARGHEPVLVWDKSRKYLYAAFAEGSEEDGECEKFCRIKVKRWDGSQWKIVGEKEFITDGFGTEVELVASNIDDLIYAAFENIDSDSKKIRVKKWDGLRWSDIADDENPNGIISGILAIKPSLAIDEQDNLYISFAGTGEKDIYVKKWNGEKWQEIGNEPACLEKCTESSIDVDAKGNIYLAFSEFEENVEHKKKIGKSYDFVKSDMWRLRVKYFNGQNWQPLDDEKYSDGFISEGNGKADPELDVANGNLYVSFTDKASGNATCVKKYKIE